jgi:hypothetical protein
MSSKHKLKRFTRIDISSMKRILRKVTQKENKTNLFNKFKSLFRRTQNAMIVTASRTGVMLQFCETKTNRLSEFKPNQTFPASSWTRKSLMWFLRTHKQKGLVRKIIVLIWANNTNQLNNISIWGFLSIRWKINQFRSSLNPVWMLAAIRINRRCVKSCQSQRPDWRVAWTP